MIELFVEMLVSLIGLLGELLNALFQATVGVIWPNKDPSIRRLQRICAATLLGAFCAIAVAVATAFLRPSWLTMVLFGIAILLIFVSALLGYSIERSCTNKDKSKDEN